MHKKTQIKAKNHSVDAEPAFTRNGQAGVWVFVGGMVFGLEELASERRSDL